MEFPIVIDSHNHNLIVEHPKNKPCIVFSTGYSHPPAPQPQATTNLPFVYKCIIVNILYNWNYILMWLFICLY